MIFVDESIQEDLGYICVACVYCAESPSDLINRALRDVGLTPGKDEYKSGARMVGHPYRQVLRDRIADIVRMHCTIATYIAPVEERAHLLDGIIDSAQRIVAVNELEAPQVVIVDEGIAGGVVPDASKVLLKIGCDSKIIPGIQLADYAAYHCSYMLKREVTGVVKTVTLDLPEHPYDQEEVELEWLIRSDLRRNFFMEQRNIDEIDGDDWFFRLDGYGAFFSPNLPDSLSRAAREAFGAMYMGCIF